MYDSSWAAGQVTACFAGLRFQPVQSDGGILNDLLYCRNQPKVRFVTLS